jgi:hypothetical protein
MDVHPVMKDPSECSHPIELQSTSIWSTAVPPEHPGFTQTTRTICRDCGKVLKDETVGPFVEDSDASP